MNKTKKQNITGDIEVKTHLTETRVGEGKNGGKKGKVHQGTCINYPCIKPKEDRMEGGSLGFVGWGKVVG